MEKLVPISEIAGLTALSVSTIYKRTSAGTIPFYKIGKRVLFKPSEIDQWLEDFQKEVRL